jgi:hypothetical protein
MRWLIWRQHRVQLMLAAALVAALGIPIWITGMHLATTLHDCQASDTCGSFDLLQHYGAIRVIVNLTIIVPVLVGVFWGATIAGRELETGTAALVWTQSITRRRWIAIKLCTLFAFAIACSGAISALVTWWSNPANATLESRFDGPQFDIQNIAPVGYAIFAAALGLAAGVLWRRVMPAVGTTLAVFIGVRLLIELWARSHYLTPVTKLSSFKGPDGTPFGAWSISNDLTLHGQVVNGPVAPPGACAAAAASRADMDTCMQRAGYVMRAVYQPANRYWTFQWIEFGIYAGLAVVLVAVAVFALRRRDA